MFKLNIKTRILCFVVFFELIAYSTIQLFNNYIYKNELLELKNKEIQQTFAASTARINNQVQLLERNVTDLSIAGEQLFSQRKAGLLSVPQLEKEVERILVLNFSGFPEAIGGGIWYEPYLIDTSKKYFGPYAFQQGNQVEFSWDLNTPEYDYHNQDWYSIASKANWGLEQSRFRPIFWTPPYFDDAGTFSLMMTVDAVMLSEQNQVIGMTTVDWSLTELTSFLASVRISDNSYPFLIHKSSKQFLSYPKDPEMVMKYADQFNWGKAVLNKNLTNHLDRLENIVLDGTEYSIYFYNTNSGFIFGSLSPVSDMTEEIDTITTVTLIAGAGIGAGFIILMVLLMRFLFSPFDKVLALIRNSIARKPGNESVVEIKPISYQEENEFTPIVKALGEVYQQVTSYISEIIRNNEHLLASKAEIKALNNELEEKVVLRTEQLAAKTQQALDSLTQLKATQQQLIEHEKHASLGRLVAGIAHEINTPLGISITAASTMEDVIHDIYSKANSGKLKKDEFSSSYQRLLESSSIVITNLRRTSDLVSSFKQVAVDQSSEELRRFNLHDYLTKIIRSLQPKITQSNSNLELICEDKSLEIFSSPGAIAQIITNLVENALIHGFTGTESGLIKIRFHKTAASIELSVSDNGKGMAPEVRECVFDPFFTTARQSGGSGLGMHIVYNLVTQQLHGDIECKSQPGEGTIYSITFPIMN